MDYSIFFFYTIKECEVIMKRYQFYKVASATPEVFIGDPAANKLEILKIMSELDPDTQLVVFPELALSGYSCQDLFLEDVLLRNVRIELEDLVSKMPQNLLAIVGLPLVIENRLYNCAAFIRKNEVLAIQAKTYIPSYNEFYETRWFSSGRELPKNATVTLLDKAVMVSNDILVEDLTTGAKIAVEICEDLWVPIPVSTKLALAGANILCNCSASNEIISKESYRRNLVIHQSASTYSAYIYSSAGTSESTSDLVFSNHNLIAENGYLLKETTIKDRKKFISSEIDLQHLISDRIHFKTSFEDSYSCTCIQIRSNPIDLIQLTRPVNAYPFVPQDKQKRIERCHEILNIQAHGLATRLKKIHCQDVVIGISGGLDSTLALLVCAKAFEINKFDTKGIHAITMPGFGTTHRTKNNAQILMDILQVDSKEISIVPSVNQHFIDISQDPNKHDITYENSQARERTQILMDLANKTNGLVVGTGDLSELALGWCTYNGDHMSMYAVNASVPKTLVRYICESVALDAKQSNNLKLYNVLMDICDTPVSPELLPPDSHGKIQQKTEEVLGSYDLHDFFLYHMLRHHEEPKKIFDLAKLAFQSVDSNVILKAVQTFYSRFFTQQFKRNCMPDGVKVGSICFSPRGDWRMPSDASRNLWLKQVNELNEQD